MTKISSKNHIKGTAVAPEFNVSKVRAMSNKEAEERAKKDPDAPIVDPAKVRRVKRIL
ncbi:hypothetical protein MO867_07370 [Microbulbifer sp. OS29]|uniref:Uncharacterized protein n=1 Tax=Microbulbifer okhotskensis TaxID=2926617 RepID=A0A9X2EL14_9GAMM|nr:hypothetical protein [Microbulbifer okhotskensis]MCO1334162.1 hypothetical protein [Microbulbifer okhotskensis]